MVDSAAEAPVWDFFVSYTHADRAWAEWIASLLEEDGHRVLVQAWDMVPGTNWISRMDQGVQGATRTVAVLSPDYFASVYGTVEWQAAWAADLQGQRRKLITVRVRGDRPAGLLTEIVGIDLVGLVEATARRRLREEINAAVQGRAKPSSPPPFPRAVPAEPRFPGALPEVYTVPGRNPHFTGRCEELEAIRAELGARREMTVQTLHGMGGVGKTQTVIEYAHRHATTYDLTWWINAEQPSLITSQFAALAGSLGLPAGPNPEITTRAVCAELRRRERWLLIFDNAEDVEHIRPVLPGGAGHVLITTRRSGFDYLGPVLDLDVFPHLEATTLLRRRAPTLTDHQADAIAELLGDLPLALEQAAAYLNRTQLPPADYLHLLTTRAADMYGRGRVVEHQHTIATLWSLSLDQLRAAQPTAVQLLGLCAHLAPEPIPLDLFTGHPEQLPPPLSHVARDPLAFAETVGALLDYSLARRTAAGLRLHRLVQAVIRQPGPTQPDPQSLPVVLNLLAADLPETIVYTPENWPRWQRLLPHVLAATDHHDDSHPFPTTTTSWLLDRTATYKRTHGQLTVARSLQERALRIDEKVHGPDHPQVATRLNNLAWTLLELHEPATARVMAERALHLAEATYGPDHGLVASSLNHVALALLQLGEPVTARPLLERILHITEAAYEADDPELAGPLGNLAQALEALGELATAQALLERALNINETAFGPDHPAVANTLELLACVLCDLGDLATARPLYERALHITKTVYGLDHRVSVRIQHALQQLSGTCE